MISGAAPTTTHAKQHRTVGNHTDKFSLLKKSLMSFSEMSKGLISSSVLDLFRKNIGGINGGIFYPLLVLVDFLLLLCYICDTE